MAAPWGSGAVGQLGGGGKVEVLGNLQQRREESLEGVITDSHQLSAN